MIAPGTFRAQTVASSACLKPTLGVSTNRRHRAGLALNESTFQGISRTGRPNFDRWAFVCLP